MTDEPIHLTGEHADRMTEEEREQMREKIREAREGLPTVNYATVDGNGKLIDAGEGHVVFTDQGLGLIKAERCDGEPGCAPDCRDCFPSASPKGIDYDDYCDPHVLPDPEERRQAKVSPLKFALKLHEQRAELLAAIREASGCCGCPALDKVIEKYKETP